MFKDLLLGAYTLEITPLDVAGALLDETARRSTLTPKYSATVKVRCQFRYTTRLARDGGSGRERTVRGSGGSALPGADVSSVAEAVITRNDGERAGYEPRMGDRILGVIDRQGRIDRVTLYVTRAGYQNEQPGGFADWLLLLSDRTPARTATS